MPFDNQFTRLYLIRHGQVAGHETPRYNGHTDVDLSPLGRAQLEAWAEDLADTHLDAVYSSDLRRARYGGEHLVRNRDLELRIEPAFREMGFGEWEGMSFDEVNAKFPGVLKKRWDDPLRHRIPGGESIEDVWQRVKSGLDRLLASHRNQSVALVAHSGVNRVILLQALGGQPEQIWRIDQGYGCLNTIHFYENGMALVTLTNGPNRIQPE